MEERCLQLSPKDKHVLDPSNFTRDCSNCWVHPDMQMFTDYDLVFVVAKLRMFESDVERRGLAGVYTVKSSERYFGYAVVNEVWHIESIL